ncbi:MAG TPA: phosphatase PAP2 family protein [Chloroflexaceae bacterium]|nr:phosphatase PAP2 family protein [Chloroflexaceae bacterium]
MNLRRLSARRRSRRPLAAALLLAALLAAQLAPPSASVTAQPAQMVEPDAGTWDTWLLESGSELRLPVPPGRGATQAELRQLQGLVGQRAAAADQIARWTSGGPAYRWNELALQAALERGLGTTPASRMFALLNAAIYDTTVAAWDSKYAHNRPRPSVQFPALSAAAPVPNSPSYPSEDAAIAAAASEVLSFLFPGDADFFRAMAAEAGQTAQIAGLAYPSDVAAGEQLGRAVAERAIAYARSDNTDVAWDGERPTGPGYWTGSNPVTPQAGQWRTWVLSAGSELRPGPPPAFGSPELEAEMQELRAFQRTPQTNATAFFWQHGAGGTRAYAYFNERLLRKVLEYGLDANPPRAAEAFLLPNIAMFDAFVACWDAKFTYWSMRPDEIDPSFTPLFRASPYPGYPSAASCVTQGVFTVMAHLFPRDLGTFYALAEEAAESRIGPAGIHIRSDVTVGRALGWAVAQRVIARAQAGGLD